MKQVYFMRDGEKVFVEVTDAVGEALTETRREI
jgi:hypothetical protein